MYEARRPLVEFLFVYIREAHAIDQWPPPDPNSTIRLESAKRPEQKQAYAASCVGDLGVQFPTVVDGMDHAVETAYTAWPDRLYLVGRDGRIAWKGDQGPWRFWAPELERAIARELGES
jgi:iodothyronine deiodinase-like protein